MKSLRLLSRATRTPTSLPLQRSLSTSSHAFLRTATPSTRHSPLSRPFTSSSSPRLGLTPDAADPKPPKTEDHPSDVNAVPAELSDSEYQTISDQYLDALVLALEEKAESNEKLEVEYSAGVLTVMHPRGTYVINKQPPNKQIWLSSPESGPKRFDWVEAASGQHEKQESEGAEGGDDGSGGMWVYLRDGTSLSELLRKEVGVSITAGDAADAATVQKGGLAGSGVSE